MRDRGRGAERQTDREREREREMQADRQRHTDRQTETERDKESCFYQQCCRFSFSHGLGIPVSCNVPKLLIYFVRFAVVCLALDSVWLTALITRKGLLPRMRTHA